MTQDATADTNPLPPFGSRRPIRGVRAGIPRMRPRPEARGGFKSSPVLPDPPSALVGAVDADPCASPSARKPTFVAPANQANAPRQPTPHHRLPQPLPT